MPNSDKTPQQIEAETDKLIQELAQAFVRDLRAATRNAPYGKILHHAEIFAVMQGREFRRKALETMVQEQNDIIEKKRNKRMSLRWGPKTSRI